MTKNKDKKCTECQFEDGEHSFECSHFEEKPFYMDKEEKDVEYIHVKKGKIARTEDVKVELVLIDYDKNNNVLGIEILYDKK